MSSRYVCAILALVACACGRVSFTSRDGGAPDAGRRDGGPDARVDGAIVRPECAAAFEDPASAPDMVLWSCGIDMQLGQCFVFDATTCTTCACDSYVGSHIICSPTGSCGPPLNGTGCSSASFYAGEPFFCSGDPVPQSACMLRVLIRDGYC